MNLGAGASLRREYSIRVLIPCYKESLAIVRRTISAARKAHIPGGCRVTIYLCDDGKDPLKRDFCNSFKVRYQIGSRSNCFCLSHISNM